MNFELRVRIEPDWDVDIASTYLGEIKVSPGYVRGYTDVEFWIDHYLGKVTRGDLRSARYNMRIASWERLAYKPSENYDGLQAWADEHGLIPLIKGLPARERRAILDTALRNGKASAVRLVREVYILQDLKRLLDLYNGEWYYVVIEVEAVLGGRVIGSAVIGGVESDSDYSYLIDEMKDEAKIDAEGWLEEVCLSKDTSESPNSIERGEK